MRIVDLSMPIGPHFRWPTETPVRGDIAGGDQFRVTRLHTTCHGFTHVDAQAHMLAQGPTIEMTPLDDVVGFARLIDLRGTCRPSFAIGPAELAATDPGGDERILVVATGWDGQRDPATRDYWLDAPFITREGARWLAGQRPTAVAFDFPQDHAVRKLLDGGTVPFEEHVTHDICLRAGITLIEYLANTTSLREPRMFLSAAPLRIPGADGSPARVHAIEGLREA
jgi:arylformamidase